MTAPTSFITLDAILTAMRTTITQMPEIPIVLGLGIGLGLLGWLIRKVRKGK